jgi:hypothetical protein
MTGQAMVMVRQAMVIDPPAGFTDGAGSRLFSPAKAPLSGGRGVVCGVVDFADLPGGAGEVGLV